MGLTAAELEAVLTVDDGPLKAGLDGVAGMMQNAVGSWGKVLGGAGLVGGAAFAAGLGGALNLDQVTDRVAAELGLTEAEAARAGNASGAVFADGWGSSMDEVGAATTAVLGSIKGLRSGTEAEIEAMTTKALILADVFQVDVAEAANAAGAAVASGLAKDGAEAFDLLTTTMQKVGPQLRGEVLSATEEYSQFFAAVGLSGPEAFGMLADSAGKGMYGIDKTGDAIKEFTIRSTDMSKTTSDAYKTLGLDTQTMTNELLAGGDRAGAAFDQIIDGVLSIKDPAQQSQAALALFGTPLEDLGAKDIPKFLESLSTGSSTLEGFKGSTEKAGEALSNNAAANLSTFGRQVQMHLVNALGRWAVPAITAVTGALVSGLGPTLSVVGGMLATFAGWVQANAEPLKLVAGIIGAVYIPLLIALGVQALASGAMVVAGWVMAGAAGLANAAILSAVYALQAAGWLWMGAQALLGAARVAAAWLIALGPIGWAIAAIALVVGIVIKYWDQIAAATSAAWNWVVGAVTGAAKAVWGAIVAAFTAVVTTVTGAVSRVSAVIRTGVAIWRAVITAVLNAIRATAAAVWNAVVAVVASAVTRVLGAIRGISSIVATVRGFFQNAKQAASDKLGELVNLAKGIPGRVKGALGNMGSLLYNAGKELIQGLIDGLTAMLGKLRDKVASVANTVKGFFPGSPVKEGPLTSWNNGGAGKRLVGMLADGLSDTSPVDVAMSRLGTSVHDLTPVPASEGREVYRERVEVQDRGPLIGELHQLPGESPAAFAERVWRITRSRG